MSDKILLADGLLEIDEEALKFCLSFEVEIYYHALAEGRGKRLLYDLLSANGKCTVIEVNESELNDLLEGGDYQEAHIFCKKRGRQIALGIAAGLAVLVCGIALGAAVNKTIYKWFLSE